MPHLLILATLRPDPDEARSWVETELHRAEYRQSLVDRFFAWLQELWDRLTSAALGANPLSTGAAVLVLVVLVVLVGLVVSRVRREPLRAVGGEAVLLTGQVTPEEHRRAAEAALAEDDYDLAIVEAFRALAARAVQRGLVQERPGLTAHELATDLRPLFPGHAAGLDRSSALFDLVFYGDQPAAAADARSVLDLDEALRGARPSRTVVDQPDQSTAVPR
jgi:hypothetical protein